jgi:hypothetical protein
MTSRCQEGQKLSYDCGLSTDLKAKAPALESHHRGSAPRSPEVFTLAARHRASPVAPPTINAAFRTEGETTTQSALSSQSCGMLSGTSRISFKTVPQFLSRSSSLVWSTALATSASGGRTTNRTLPRQANSLRHVISPRSIFLTQTPDDAARMSEWSASRSPRKWFKTEVFGQAGEKYGARGDL